MARTRKKISERKPHRDPWSFQGLPERASLCDKLPPAVRRLLAIEWARRATEDARRVLPIFEAHFPYVGRPRKAIEAAESLINKPDFFDASDYAAAAQANTASHVAYAAHAAHEADSASDADYVAAEAAEAAYAAHAAAHSATYRAKYAAHMPNYEARATSYATHANYASNAASCWLWLSVTYWHAYGPDFPFDPCWRTTTAVALARGIVAERAFDRMPILADALQDAGCDDPGLIRHLQEDREEWTIADWVLCNLLETS